MRLKPSIVRINIVAQKLRGTGVVVAERYILTALHVVADRKTAPPRFYPHPIYVHVKGTQMEATVVDSMWDADHDWVLLKFPGHPQVLPAPLGILRSHSTEIPWETFGFPDAKPDGIRFIGEVRDFDAAYHGSRAFQLYCSEAAAGNGAPVLGLSGAPCIISDVVVGIIRSSLLDPSHASVAGTLFACPASNILSKAKEYLGAPRVLSFPTASTDVTPDMALLVGRGEHRLSPAAILDRRPPPAPRLLMQRQSLVASVRQKLQSSPLSLVGEPGCGKTQLARQVSDHTSIWLNLKDRSAADCATLITKSIAGPSDTSTILILDGLCRIPPSGSLYSALAEIAVNENNLLLTSNFSLPSGLIEDFGIEEFPLPALTVDEVKEWLDCIGAPSAEHLRLSRFIHSLTKGHPQLVRALTAFLHKHGWVISDNVLDGAMKGDYREHIQREATFLIRDTVPDPVTRELLYRLDRIIGTFTSKDLEIVASVPPTIGFPGEKLIELSPIWVQDEADGRYSLSALAKGSSEMNLSAEVRSRVARALGERILAESTLDEYNMMRAITYMLNAGDFAKAGALYIHSASLVPSEQAKTSLLLSTWMGTPLPTGMAVHMKIFVRATQIGILLRRNQSSKNTVAEIENLLPQLDTENKSSILAMMMAATMAGLYADPPSMLSTFGIQKFALQRLSLLALVEQDTDANGLRDTLLQSIYVSGAGVKSIETLLPWVRSLCEFRKQCPEAGGLASKFGTQGQISVPRQVWFAETDPNRALALAEGLDEAVSVASEAGMITLAASLESTRILVYGTRFRDPETCEEIGRRFLERHPQSQDARFLIGQALGMELAMLDRPEKAASALKSALTTQNPVDRIFYIDGLLALSSLSHVKSPTEAVAYCQAAVTYLRSQTGLGVGYLTRALGMLGVILAETNGLTAAYDTWRECVLLILQFDPVTDLDKDAYAKCGHCLGYYSGLAMGRPPRSLSSDADEPYAKPDTRMFLSSAGTQTAALYKAPLKGLLALQVGMYAENIGKPEMADYWVRRAMAVIQLENDPQAIRILRLSSLPYIIQDMDLPFALSTAITMCQDINSEQRWTLAADFVLVPSYVRFLTDVQLTGVSPAVRDTFHQAYISASSTSGEARLVAEVQVLERLLVGSVTLAELKALEARSREGEGNDTLITLLKYAASVHPECSPRGALASHIVALTFNWDIYRRTPIIRLVIFPFLLAFWQHKVARMRSVLSSPQLVDAGIAESHALGGEAGCRLLMLTIADGLRSDLPQNFRAWLEGSSDYP